MNLDRVFEISMGCDSNNFDASLALLASLPAISMLIKLMERKQNGKKPFSVDFDYQVKMNAILFYQASFFQQLEIKKIDKETKLFLDKLLQISLKASEEIKMESLKNDYRWIANTFLNASSLIG